jgi:UDP-N-acetylmuramyl tripeptide synthase
VATVLRRALAEHPDITVVANADDPMVVFAVGAAARVVWVAAGRGWRGDVLSCPGCGAPIDWSESSETRGTHWRCDCGLHRPTPTWWLGEDAVDGPDGPVELRLSLPGEFNRGNAALALAAARVLGISAGVASTAMESVSTVAGRYGWLHHGPHRVRMLLAKNPAGWAEALGLIAPDRPVLLLVNARRADGYDTSWLWDIDFTRLAGVPVVASGERAGDLGVRLSYAQITHHTEPDPLRALAALPHGAVEVIANYTAFHQMRRRLNTSRS